MGVEIAARAGRPVLATRSLGRPTQNPTIMITIATSRDGILAFVAVEITSPIANARMKIRNAKICVIAASLFKSESFLPSGGTLGIPAQHQLLAVLVEPFHGDAGVCSGAYEEF
jgi:hypothetical protein